MKAIGYHQSIDALRIFIVIYTIDHRDYHYKSTIAQTLDHDDNQPYYSELSFLTVIDVQGAQAASFLQGQLTNHIQEIPANGVQTNLLCNLKGQIVTKLWIMRDQDHYMIICPHDLSQALITILNKTALLSKVILRENPTQKVYGLYTEQKLAISLHVPIKYLLKPDLFWHYIGLKHQQFEIYPSSSKIFVPHQLELEKSGWVHFQKGCYRGQEIIARMHYLGKSKYHIQQCITELPEEVKPGMTILNKEKQPIGQLIDWCPINDKEHLLNICIKKNTAFCGFC